MDGCVSRCNYLMTTQKMQGKGRQEKSRKSKLMGERKKDPMNREIDRR